MKPFQVEAEIQLMQNLILLTFNNLIVEFNEENYMGNDREKLNSKASSDKKLGDGEDEGLKNKKDIPKPKKLKKHPQPQVLQTAQIN